MAQLPAQALQVRRAGRRQGGRLLASLHAAVLRPLAWACFRALSDKQKCNTFPYPAPAGRHSRTPTARQATPTPRASRCCRLGAATSTWRPPASTAHPARLRLRSWASRPMPGPPPLSIDASCWTRRRCWRAARRCALLSSLAQSWLGSTWLIAPAWLLPVPRWAAGRTRRRLAGDAPTHMPGRDWVHAAGHQPCQLPSSQAAGVHADGR